LISAETLRHRITAIDSVKIMRGTPMDAERVAVDRAVLIQWYNDLTRRVEGVPHQFVFHVDETGYCDEADRWEVRVVVPTECDTVPVPVPIPMNTHSKPSTLTHYIAADCHRMHPFGIMG
jgi:hypothetical protein